MNISEGQMAYAEQVCAELKKVGIRAEVDLRNEKIGYKIREHSMQKTPFQVVVGDKEMTGNLVAVRDRAGQDLGQMGLPALVSLLNKGIAERSGVMAAT
jgi:threonyl-tRNA synthetase